MQIKRHHSGRHAMQHWTYIKYSIRISTWNEIILNRILQTWMAQMVESYLPPKACMPLPVSSSSRWSADAQKRSSSTRSEHQVEKKNKQTLKKQYRWAPHRPRWGTRRLHVCEDRSVYNTRCASSPKKMTILVRNASNLTIRQSTIW